MAVLTAALAGIAAAGAIGGGIMQANSQKAQAKANRDAQINTNLLNYALYIQQRGGDPGPILQQLGFPDAAPKGSALLPMYAPRGTEEAMLADALAASKAIGAVPPETSLAEFRAIVDSVNPAVAGGDQVLNSIYNGELAKQRSADLAPVLAARTEGAIGQQEAVRLGLEDAVNRVAADEARKGFVGAGSFGRNRMVEATIPAAERAAAVMSNAKLQNAMDQRALEENNLQLQLGSLDMPFKRAGSKINLAMTPEQAVAQRFTTSQEPLKFFRIGPGNAPDMRAPLLQPYGDAGAAALSGIAGAAGQIGGLIATNQAASRLGTMNRMVSAGEMPSNFGAMTPSQQSDYMSAWSNAQATPSGIYE